MDSLPYGLAEQWRLPLAFATGVAVYFLTWLLLGFLLKKLFLKSRLIVHLTLICLAILCPALLFFPEKKWIMEVKSAMAILSSILAWVLFDRLFFTLFLARRKKIKVPIILRQIMAFLLVFTTIALVMTYGYGVKITGLIATSGVAAIILGFAMQDLLANVIAGFSIQMTKAYKVGDWLLLHDTDHRAEVTEVNWRSTRLLDTDRISFEIPNSELIKSQITNLNYPSREHGVRLRVGIDYDQPPNNVKDAFLAAMQRVQGVLESPPPAVFLVDFGDSAVIYELRFWMRSPHLYNQACDEIRTKLWYELQRRQIRIPFPIRTLERRKPNIPSRLVQATDDAASILQSASCLHCLTHEQAQQIAEQAPRRLFAHGEILMREGEEGDSMYVILDGRVDVFIKTPSGGSEKIGTLTKGDYVGEMSLLTGEPRSATVRANGDVLVMEVNKHMLAPILKKQPELVETLSEMLAKRQEEIDETRQHNAKSAKHPQTPPHEAQKHSSANLLKRIKSFFQH